MEIVSTVLYGVLAVLVPVGAVVFAARSQRRDLPPGPSWSVCLEGDGPPYPAGRVNGHLVVGDRLVWVANSDAGQIDFTETGLHVVRLEPPSDDSPTLVCVDGMGTVLRWSASASPPGIRDLERALRARPMPELVSPPTVEGPRGHALGGAPGMAAAAGSLLVAGLVFAALAPGDQLGSPAGQAMAATGWLTVVLGLPVALVVWLFVRPLHHRRMRAAVRRMHAMDGTSPTFDGSEGSGGAVPVARRPAPVALVVSADAGELSWRDAAELVRRRATVERWAQVGKRSAFRPMPWWQLLLIGIFVVTPLTVFGVAFVADNLDLPHSIAGMLAIGTPVAIVALIWFDDHRKQTVHRAALAGPSTRVPYVIARDPTPDTKRSVLLLAAREADKRTHVGHRGWLQVPFTTDQRRLTPAGVASIYGTLGARHHVVVVIDDHDRETADVTATIGDDEVRRLVMPPEVPPPRSWWQRRIHVPSA